MTIEIVLSIAASVVSIIAAIFGGIACKKVKKIETKLSHNSQSVVGDGNTQIVGNGNAIKK